MPITTTTSEAPLTRPVTYRLPKPGTQDVHFGLSRAHYYALEKRGLLRLIRIRDKNKRKGVTLIIFQDVARLVAAQAQAQEESVAK